MNNLKNLIPLSVRRKIKTLLGRDGDADSKKEQTIELGEGSQILSLRKVNGPQYIKIGKGTFVGNYAWLGAYDEYAGIKYTPRLIIGDHVNIGDFVCITCIGELVIHDGCLFSEYVYISDHVHGFDPRAGRPDQQPLMSKGNVEIGENSFLGYRAVILPGVKLGKHCVVGANSVVTHSFPDYSMVAGVPAKLIKTFSFENNTWMNS